MMRRSRTIRRSFRSLLPRIAALVVVVAIAVTGIFLHPLSFAVQKTHAALTGWDDTTYLTRDGKVGLLDVSLLLSRWNSTSAADLDLADINGPNGVPDGVIDIWDANVLMRNWTL